MSIYFQDIEWKQNYDRRNDGWMECLTTQQVAVSALYCLYTLVAYIANNIEPNQIRLHSV